MSPPSVSFADCCCQSGRGEASHKERVSVLTAMSLLVNKMKHGSQLVLSWLVIVLKPLLQCKIPCRLRTHEVRTLPSHHHRSKIYLACLCCSEEPKTAKTAWEYYNEGAYLATS